MKIHFLILIFFSLTLNVYGQGALPAPIKTAIQSDDVELLKKEITADNINTCYGRNSLLSLCIKVTGRRNRCQSDL